MTDQITWQNINGPDLAAASRPLEAAQRSFSGVFDQLGGILAQYQQTGEKNWQNTKTNNTNAFLDRLASYKTPEELAAAQASGELGRFRSGFGAQVDSNILRGAEEQRINALRTGVKQAGEYEDYSIDRSQRGVKDQIGSLIAAGKFSEAQSLLDQNELRNEAALATSLTGAQRQRTEWKYADNDDSRKTEKQKADIENARKQLLLEGERNSISRSQVGIQRSQLELQQGEAADRRDDRLSAKLLATSTAMGKAKGNTIDTQEGMESVAKYIRDNYKDPNTQANLLAKANAIATQGVRTKDGVSIPIRADAMLKAIGATEDTRWWGTKWANDSDQGDYIKQNLIKILSDPGYIDQTKAQMGQRDVLKQELQRIVEQQKTPRK